jgi:Domain of unknown function (DUF2017)
VGDDGAALTVRLRRPFARSRHGFVVRLSAEERDMLRELPSELRTMLAMDHPALGRLFPPAYTDDEERNAEYHRLMRTELLAKKIAALDVLEESVDKEHLDEEGMLAWMGALNDLRLVLGTALDVAEDMDDEPFDAGDPRSHQLAVYQYLTYLVDAIVSALGEP